MSQRADDGGCTRGVIMDGEVETGGRPTGGQNQRRQMKKSISEQRPLILLITLNAKLGHYSQVTLKKVHSLMHKLNSMLQQHICLLEWENLDHFIQDLPV